MSALTSPLRHTISSSAQFDYWWTLPGHWVEAPNERRNGWSGVIRTRSSEHGCYIKRQRNHLCRTPTHPLGWPTASREAYFLQQVSRLGIKVPELLFHGARHTRAGTEAILATRALDGYTALSEQTGLNTAHQHALATELGTTLGLLHRARLQHGCLYDKHIMVRWQGTHPHIALLDLEKMRRRFSAAAAAGRDLDQLRRHQDVLAPASWAQLLAAHRRALIDPHQAGAPGRIEHHNQHQASHAQH